MAKHTAVLGICCWRNFNSSALHVILNPATKDRTTSLESPLKPFVFKTVNSNRREDNTVHTSCQKTPHLFLKQRKLEQHIRNDRPHYTLSIFRASNTACLQQAHANNLPRYLNAGRPPDIAHRVTNRQAPIKDDSCHNGRQSKMTRVTTGILKQLYPEREYSQTYRPTKMACNI